jgi:hypothetical protein
MHAGSDLLTYCSQVLVLLLADQKMPVETHIAGSSQPYRSATSLLGLIATEMLESSRDIGTLTRPGYTVNEA